MKTQSTRLALLLSAMEATQWCRLGFQVEDLGLACYANIFLHLCSICRGLVFCSISFHALAVSAKAGHATLYLITPWQYLPRLGILGNHT